jgi:hypothetical protein
MATARRPGQERRIEARCPTRRSDAQADEGLRAVCRDYDAELLSLAMLGRHRGPLD